MRFTHSMTAALCLMAMNLTAQSAPASAPAAKPVASPAFAKIKSLVGTWRAKGPMGITTVVYTVISGGSCVEERMIAGKVRMLTVYCVEGDGVALVHYCDSGNQPNLKADGLNTEGDSLTFNFVKAGNLATAETGHMNRLVLTLKDAKRLTHAWNYRENGKDTPWTFEYTRVK